MDDGWFGELAAILGEAGRAEIAARGVGAAAEAVLCSPTPSESDAMPDAGPMQPTTIQRLQDGVVPAFALLAGMQLDLFTPIAEEALTAEELAARLGVDANRLSRLLYALTAAGLLAEEDGRFRSGAEASEFLASGRPRYMGGSHELLASIWSANLHTAESVRAGGPAAPHDWEQSDPAQAAAALRGLAPLALAFGRALGERVDLSGAGSVIDVGGGSGTLLLGLMERWPHLRGTLLELPEVIGHAEPILAAHGGAGGSRSRRGTSWKGRRRGGTTWRCCGRCSRSWIAGRRRGPSVTWPRASSPAARC